MLKLVNYNPDTTAHALLSRHLERHQYTKGAYKGDAPADSSRRGKTHFRVVRRGEALAVLFHRTEILIAYPDGTVQLYTNGYHMNPTTRQAMSHALTRFTPWRGWLTTLAVNRYKNEAIYFMAAHPDAPSKTIAFCEGLTISPEGEVDNYGACLYRYESDRAARKEWLNSETVQEFRSLLPILWSGAEDRRRAGTPLQRKVYNMSSWRREVKFDRGQWPAFVERATYQYATWEAFWTVFRTEHTRDMNVKVEI
jgi:hypothetical protein